MADKSIDKREESLRVFSQSAKIYDRIAEAIRKKRHNKLRQVGSHSLGRE